MVCLFFSHHFGSAFEQHKNSRISPTTADFKFHDHLIAAINSFSSWAEQFSRIQGYISCVVCFFLALLSRNTFYI